MTKSLFISPEEMLKSGKIHFEDIPVNMYESDIKNEVKKFGLDAVLNLLWDMCYIREFEEGVAMLRSGKPYRGITVGAHMPSGPAHLAVGQEAAAVGQAFCLGDEDMSFGTHRAHAELLARGLKAARNRSESELLRIMEGVSGGDTYKVIEEAYFGENIREKAKKFVLYGALSEIFCKKTGFQRGASGSMHAFFTPFGCYPNNAIVGASAPIATGAALYKRINKTGGIVVANIGDGAIGCGIVYESMNFAAMDQLNGLWQEKGGLPIIFAVSDNGYGMGGQTRGETMAYDMLARLGAGITKNQMLAERINGNNPFAVIDAFERKRKSALQGEGPILLDVVTYRLEGHSVSDKMSYREQCEVEDWKRFDPILTMKKSLIESGFLTALEFDERRERISKEVEKIFNLVADNTKSPIFSGGEAIEFYKQNLFNNEKLPLPTKANLMVEKSERIREIEGISTRKDLTIRDALFESVLYNMLADEKLITYGEEVRDWGGISGVYRGLTEIFPYERLFNSPISEATIISSAIGYAFAGGKAIVEIMFADFLARTGDEIINQLAKWHTMSAGELKIPVVVRVAIGSKYGSQHSQDLSGLFAGVPGLKIVYPVTPYDAKGMLNSAIRDGNPVLFFESQKLYSKSEEFNESGVPDEYYEVPIGVPDVKLKGEDVTVVTLGGALYSAINVAKTTKHRGIMVEVIDIRSIVPLDIDPIVKSVNKTGRVVFVSDNAPMCSVMDSICREVTEKSFGSLKCAPAVLSTENVVVPPDIYCAEFYPGEQKILDKLLEMVKN